MIIKESVSKKCSECGLRSLVSPEEYGCDNCKKLIDFDKPDKEREYLQLTVFYEHREETDTLEFCSWGCVFEKLKTLKTDSFISLPYLSFNMKNEKMGVKGFWEALREACLPGMGPASRKKFYEQGICDDVVDKEKK